MKTRHATLEQLCDIISECVEQMLRLESNFHRAFQRHDGEQSRHFRKLVRKYASIEARYSAAQRCSNKIMHAGDPEFLF